MPEIIAAIYPWFNDIWRRDKPVEFKSSFGLSESVERLKGITRRSIFIDKSILLSEGQQQAVGNVNKSRVFLYKVIGKQHNSFKPFFRGHFQEEHGAVILMGKFTMHWFTKGFLVVWFGGLGYVLVVTLAHIREAPFAWLAPLGMTGVGIWLTTLLRWYGLSDILWLSEVIRSALCAASIEPESETPPA